MLQEGFSFKANKKGLNSKLNHRRSTIQLIAAEIHHSPTVADINNEIKMFLTFKNISDMMM